MVNYKYIYIDEMRIEIFFRCGVLGVKQVFTDLESLLV